MSIESIMRSNQVVPRSSLLLSSIFSSIRVFSNESALHVRGPNYWSSSFSISPSNEYSGLISFRINWLTSLQSKGLSSIFSSTTVWKHQFFDTQPFLWTNSHFRTWLLEKTIDLTIWTFVSKVMSLLFNVFICFMSSLVNVSFHQGLHSMVSLRLREGSIQWGEWMSK